MNGLKLVFLDENQAQEIINCRVTYEQIRVIKQIMIYSILRYFVSDFVEDKALYLDCDLVVTKNLDNYLKQICKTIQKYCDCLIMEEEYTIGREVNLQCSSSNHLKQKYVPTF